MNRFDREASRIIGARLRAARAEAGLTQAALGAKSELGRSTVAMLETGAQGVSVAHVYAIAQALQRVPEELVPLDELSRLAKRRAASS